MKRIMHILKKAVGGKQLATVSPNFSLFDVMLLGIMMEC